MNKKLPARTPWFKCKTPPTRPGKYETRLVICGEPSQLVLLSRWDRRGWARKTLVSYDEWRGLTEQVK